MLEGFGVTVGELLERDGAVTIGETVDQCQPVTVDAFVEGEHAHTFEGATFDEVRRAVARWVTEAPGRMYVRNESGDLVVWLVTR